MTATRGHPPNRHGLARCACHPLQAAMARRHSCKGSQRQCVRYTCLLSSRGHTAAMPQRDRAAGPSQRPLAACRSCGGWRTRRSGPRPARRSRAPATWCSGSRGAPGGRAASSSQCEVGRRVLPRAVAGRPSDHAVCLAKSSLLPTLLAVRGSGFPDSITHQCAALPVAQAIRQRRTSPRVFGRSWRLNPRLGSCQTATDSTAATLCWTPPLTTTTLRLWVMTFG